MQRPDIARQLLTGEEGRVLGHGNLALGVGHHVLDDVANHRDHVAVFHDVGLVAEVPMPRDDARPSHLVSFGHGQVEGFTEKYGMEYRRAYHDEQVDGWLVDRHARELFPLLHRREQFAEVADFTLYDFEADGGEIRNGSDLPRKARAEKILGDASRWREVLHDQPLRRAASAEEIAVTTSIRSTPAGARVSYRRYATPDQPWTVLGGLDHGYPAPIVDHALERLDSLERLAELPKGTQKPPFPEPND